MYIIIIIINRPCLTRRSGPFPRALAPCVLASWCPKKEAGARGKPRLALALLLAPAQVVRQVPIHAKRFAAVAADVPPAHHVALPLSLSTAWMAPCLAPWAQPVCVSLPLPMSTAPMSLLASLPEHSPDVSPCLSPWAQPGCVSLPSPWAQPGCVSLPLPISTAWMCLLASLPEHSPDASPCLSPWAQPGCVSLPLPISTAWMCLLASLPEHSLDVSPCLSPSAQPGCVSLPLSLSTAWMCLLASPHQHSLDVSPCLSPWAQPGCVSLPLPISTAWMCLLASPHQHSLDVSPCLSPSAQPGCVFRRNLLVRMALQMWHANLDLLLISVQFRLWPGRKRHHRLLNSRLCCLMSSDVVWHIKDKLKPMPKHGSINLYVHRNQKAR